MSGGGGGKSYVSGYRYLFGIHMGLGRGPVDELNEIQVGDRTAWIGSVTDNTVIDINAPNLFGGEDKEGGIQGPLHVLMGGPTQTAPTALRALFDDGMPYNVTITGSSLPSAMPGVYVRNYTNGIYSYSKSGSGINIDGAGRWMVSAGGRFFRTLDPFKSPDLCPPNRWREVTYVPGEWDYETNQQTLSEVLSSVTMACSGEYEKMPGYRQMFTAFFNGIVSMNNPYPKPWKFRFTRRQKDWDGEVWHPELCSIDIPHEDAAYGNIKAMNGVHIIYECITNRKWGRGLSRDLIDDAAFLNAAQTLYTEKFGLCMRWVNSEVIENFIQFVADHIGATIFLDRFTGLLSIKLIRSDYSPENSPVFTNETGLISIKDAIVGTVGQGVNEVEVTYRDPKLNEDRTVKAFNLAAFQASGAIVNTLKKSYIGLPTPDLALKVAQRDLRAASVNLRRYTVTLDRRGRSIVPGSVFYIQDPVRSIGLTALRAGMVSEGEAKNATITITAVQDVFSLPQVPWNTPVQNTWVPADTGTGCLDVHRVFEMPYFILAGALRRADLAFVRENDGIIGTLCARGKPMNGAYKIAARSGAPTPDDEPNTEDYFCGYVP